MEGISAIVNGMHNLTMVAKRVRRGCYSTKEMLERKDRDLFDAFNVVVDDLFDNTAEELTDAIKAVLAPSPIPMLLWCPECRGRHIDEGEFATKHHHTHACQHCGHVWRPAIVPTCGVQFLPGFKDGAPFLPGFKDGAPR
jgi:predicted RNA-binding Zn-ribbon protein involved in translation (DUF1610 family)